MPLSLVALLIQRCVAACQERGALCLFKQRKFFSLFQARRDLLYISFFTQSNVLLQHAAPSKRLIATPRQETCLLNVIVPRTSLRCLVCCCIFLQLFSPPQGLWKFLSTQGLYYVKHQTGTLMRILISKRLLICSFMCECV